MNTKRERPITEDGTHEPHTGWYCYYTIFKGGQGYYEPHWLHDPTLKDHYTGDELAEYIMHEFHSSELSYVEYMKVEVFENVIPPVEIITSRIKNNVENSRRLLEYADILNDELKKFYPDAQAI